ncbi:MAG TPA: DNA replication and repair protein RecF [Saprospiraceae bacterium]|nr:DNA replication and repair protein RecF [Saprospiraceae bacterium]
MKPMLIREVSFINFKNYAEAQFQFGPKFNLIHGLNGTGKTNLLDGIYYLCVGKSYFNPHDQKIVRYNESFFRLEGDVVRDDAMHKVVIKVKPGILKELSVDGAALERISAHLGFMPVVFSAPRDVDLIYGSGISRRRYIDHLLCQVDQAYLQALVAYNHLLHMRNAALKAAFKDLKRMISTYDEQMSPYATVIFEKRKWLASLMEPLLQQIYLTLADNRENVSFSYESGLKNYPFDILADMNWEADKNTMRTNAGIHKDDYHLRIKNMPAKEYGSQGQIKSLIFALHLSKYNVLSNEIGTKPILILDDVFDKLDENRLARLMEILTLPNYGQIFLSHTTGKRVSDFISNDQLKEIAMTF